MNLSNLIILLTSYALVLITSIILSVLKYPSLYIISNKTGNVNTFLCTLTIGILRLILTLNPFNPILYPAVIILLILLLTGGSTFPEISHLANIRPETMSFLTSQGIPPDAPTIDTSTSLISLRDWITQCCGENDNNDDISSNSPLLGGASSTQDLGTSPTPPITPQQDNQHFPEAILENLGGSQPMTNSLTTEETPESTSTSNSSSYSSQTTSNELIFDISISDATTDGNLTEDSPSTSNAVTSTSLPTNQPLLNLNKCLQGNPWPNSK